MDGGRGSTGAGHPGSESGSGREAATELASTDYASTPSPLSLPATAGGSAEAGEIDGDSDITAEASVVWGVTPTDGEDGQPGRDRSLASTVGTLADGLLGQVERREPIEVRSILAFARCVLDLRATELARQVLHARSSRIRLTYAIQLADMMRTLARVSVQRTAPVSVAATVGASSLSSSSESGPSRTST